MRNGQLLALMTTILHAAREPMAGLHEDDSIKFDFKIARKILRIAGGIESKLE